MAYKRISPTPIVEGGTNATAMATQDGVVYFDGTRLVTTGAGTNAQVLTSNGAGVAPTFQNAGASGSSVMICGVGGTSNPGTVYYPLTGGFTVPSVYANYNIQTCLPQGIYSTGSAVSSVVNVSGIFAANGTAANLFGYIYSNNSSASVTVTLYKNNVATALTFTIPGNTTGTFSDTTHSVAFTGASDTALLVVSPPTEGAGVLIFGVVSFTYTA
jgi:hypothetical protein